MFDNVIDNIKMRMGYAQEVTITRDELNYLEDLIISPDNEVSRLEDEILELNEQISVLQDLVDDI